jgi:hypothetical protein
MPELDARGVTPELKLRLKFYCSWTWWVLFVLFLFVFNYFFMFLFVCFSIMGFLFLFVFSFFLSILSTLPSSFHPYSHPFNLSLSPVLKSIALLPNYSFCPFRSTLSPCPHLSSHSPPMCHQNTLPPTYSPPADKTTIPTLHKPNPLQSLIQAPYTTTTEIHSNTHKGHKTQ